MKFPGQQDGERIEFLVRKHWIVDVKILLLVFMIYLLPAMFFLSALIIYWPNFFGEWSGEITIIFLIYLLFTGLGLYIKWLNEELDLMVVTNLRIINLDQIGFMERTVSEASLLQIQDVKGIEKGMINNLLNCGNLQIRTAADKVVFHIDDIPYPFRTARDILALMDKMGANKSAS